MTYFTNDQWEQISIETRVKFYSAVKLLSNKYGFGIAEYRSADQPSIWQAAHSTLMYILERVPFIDLDQYSECTEDSIYGMTWEIENYIEHMPPETIFPE